MYFLKITCILWIHCISELSQEHVDNIFTCFLNALTEYTQDNRGDVGAWVREASMVGLETLVKLLVKCKPEMLNERTVRNITTGIAQQAVEKIDRTRALAGKIFYTLLY